MKPLCLPRVLALLGLAAALGAGLVLSMSAVAQEKKEPPKKEDKKDIKKDEKKEPEPEKKEPLKLDAPLRSLKGHNDWVNRICYSEDGKYLVSASRDRTIKLWDPAAARDLKTLKLQPEKTRGEPGIRSVVFVGPGAHVAAPTGKWNDKQKEWSGAVKLLDALAGKELKALPAHTAEILCVTASRDGKRLATGGEDMLVKIWDVEAGSELHNLKRHTGAVLAVAFHPEGKILASGGEEQEEKKEPKKEVKKEEKKEAKKDKKDKKDKKTDKPEPPKEVKPEVFKPLPVVLWDADTGKEIGVLPGPGRAVTCLAFSRDGAHLAAAGLDGTIKIWNVADKKEMYTLKTHEGVWAVAFSPDGNLLATGGYDWKIKIWDVTKGAEVRTIVAHTGTVTSLAFSPDGQLASSGLDKLINIWSVKGNK